MKVLQLHALDYQVYCLLLLFGTGLCGLEFRDPRTKSSIRLTKNFWYPFILSGLLCFGFGAFHVTGLFGPGIWVSDPYGLTGSVQPVAFHGELMVLILNPGCCISSQGSWYLSRIIPFMCSSTTTFIQCFTWEILKQFFQVVLPVFWAAFIVAGTMWYGSATTPIELFGPTRYQWDLGFFNKKLINEFKLA
jgi:photosystem II CP47 chlorophyll apoprotein